MFVNWLRSNRYAALLLTLLRLYLGYEFLHAGWEKITGEKAFDATGFLKNSLAHPVLSPDKSTVFPTFQAFLHDFALPHVKIFNFLVPWGELLVGLGLILGILTTSAMFFGVLMNFMYLMAGTVSSNPWDILLGMFILVAGYNAGKFGGDFYVIPWLRGLFNRNKPRDNQRPHNNSRINV
ncbi:DoxX family membrane protein [Tumebacillus sp. ITR2]|uniref:DoxX family membrane protein n=1 Tax=Tumebacillus amylolyticus TaxID=2801339 RepID=A0ABS1JCR3_9BACL|nr:DoxX family membrane protein [Tumebacillus amylolyticus]MBL0388074.1 DoxX family membrane protein [Tumebacillus amylolyticus]